MATEFGIALASSSVVPPNWVLSNQWNAVLVGLGKVLNKLKGSDEDETGLRSSWLSMALNWFKRPSSWAGIISSRFGMESRRLNGIPG